MLFHAALYDIQSQDGRHRTSYLATLNDGNANLALLAGSRTFIGIIFVNLVYYAAMATFGAVPDHPPHPPSHNPLLPDNHPQTHPIFGPHQP